MIRLRPTQPEQGKECQKGRVFSSCLPMASTDNGGSAIDMVQVLLNPPHLFSQHFVLLQSLFQSRTRLGDGGAGDVEVTAYVRAGKGRMLPRKVKCLRPVGICTVPERDGPIASS